MKVIVWLSVIGSIGGIALWFWKARQRIAEKQQAAEQRMVEFMAAAKPAAAPLIAAPSEVPTQKLLFDAAGKAGEANEPVLSIQLYARLLARYPETQFAAQAKAAVEAQKKKIARPRVLPPAGRD